MSMRALVILFSCACLAACGDTADAGNGEPSGTDPGADGHSVGGPVAVSFSGELAAFPDFGYDTGWLPEGSPIQVKVLVSVEGKLTATADAQVGGTSESPEMAGTPGTGDYKLSVTFVMQALLKVDFAAASFEGPISDGADIVYEVSGEAAFDPFLIGGDAVLTAPIPDTEVARIPVAGSIPGVKGDVVINLSGTIKSTFSGTCAAIDGSQAQYVGNTATSADLIIKPSVEIKIPLILDEKLAPFDVPVTTPAVDIAMDLGTKPVTPNGATLAESGSMATVGTCDTVQPPDGDVGDTPDPDATEPADTPATPEDVPTGGGDGDPTLTDNGTPADSTTVTDTGGGPGDSGGPVDTGGGPMDAGGPVDAPCVPDCTLAECGDDGCGGDCGFCGGGTVCAAGLCVAPTCADNCGASPPDGSCFCDDQCIGNGDCCSDFCDSCPATDPAGCAPPPACPAGQAVVQATCLPSIIVADGMSGDEHYMALAKGLAACWVAEVPGICFAVDALELTTTIEAGDVETWFCSNKAALKATFTALEHETLIDVFGCGLAIKDTVWTLPITAGTAAETCVAYDPKKVLLIPTPELDIDACATLPLP